LLENFSDIMSYHSALDVHFIAKKPLISKLISCLQQNCTSSPTQPHSQTAQLSWL